MTAKQIILVRTDLGMSKGKMISQGAHASLKAILDLGQYIHSCDVDGSRIVEGWNINYTTCIDYEAITEWLRGSFTKICLRVETEQQLVELIEKAKAAGLVTSLITDAGKTEFNGVPTVTCGAIGPADSTRIDPITGHLRPLL